MRLLTIDDVAGLLKISKSTLYRWVNKREIPFVKLGGKLRFNEDEIKTFILQNSFNVSDWNRLTNGIKHDKLKNMKGYKNGKSI